MPKGKKATDPAFDGALASLVPSDLDKVFQLLGAYDSPSSRDLSSGLLLDALASRLDLVANDLEALQCKIMNCTEALILMVKVVREKKSAATGPKQFGGG